MAFRLLVACSVLGSVPAVSAGAPVTVTVNVSDEARLKQEIINANGRDPAKYNTYIYVKEGTYRVSGLPSIKSTIAIIGTGSRLTTISGATGCTKLASELLPAALESYVVGKLFDPEQSYETCQGSSSGTPVFTVGPTGYLWLQGVTVRDGQANYVGGGGIHNEGMLMLNTSTVAHNRSTYGTGGGVYNTGTLRVYDSTIRQNFTYHSDGGGGIANEKGGYVEIMNSTISSNAGACAGGILNGLNFAPTDGGPLVIENSTISDNKAVAHDWNCTVSAAGLLSMSPRQAWIGNTTITQNFNFLAESVSKQRVGGVSGGAWTYIWNTLVGNNFRAARVTTGFIPAMSGDPSECGIVVSAGGNFIGAREFAKSGCVLGRFQGAQHPDVTTEADPKLGTLRDNGGNTCTHGLQPGSKAIQNGWPKGSASFEVPEYDQRWVKREGRSDIGAYAFPLVPTVQGLVCSSR